MNQFYILNKDFHLHAIKKNLTGKRKKTLFIIVSLLMIFSITQAINSQAGNGGVAPGPNDIILSLPDIMPLAYIEDSQNKGFFVELAAAMDELYQTQGVKFNGKVQKGRVILAGVYPFKRSLVNIQTGVADFHIPLLVNPLISIKDMEKNEKFNYSSAILSYGTFALYANKAFAAEIHTFEAQIGKKLSELSTDSEYRKFNEFLRQKNREIGVERAHIPFYNFTTTPVNNNQTGLKMVAAGRLDAYIHNMPECDLEITVSNIDSSDMEKIYFHRYEARAIIPLGKDNELVNQIVSQLIWGLQGRSPESVPLEYTTYGGNGQEKADNPYHRSSAFNKSKYLKIIGPVFSNNFSSEIKK